MWLRGPGFKAWEFFLENSGHSTGCELLKKSQPALKTPGLYLLVPANQPGCLIFGSRMSLYSSCGPSIFFYSYLLIRLCLSLSIVHSHILSLSISFFLLTVSLLLRVSQSLSLSLSSRPSFPLCHLFLATEDEFSCQVRKSRAVQKFKNPEWNSF